MEPCVLINHKYIFFGRATTQGLWCHLETNFFNNIFYPSFDEVSLKCSAFLCHLNFLK